MSRTIPPTPGRGALVRLDRAGVRVRLILNTHRDAVAEVDHAGVLARADQHRGALGRERSAGGPSSDLYEQCSDHITRVHGELGAVGLAAEASRRSSSNSSSVSPSCRWSGSAAASRGVSARRRQRGLPAATRTAAARRSGRGRVDGVLGVRHEPDHVARARCGARRCVRGAVGVVRARRPRRRASSSGTRRAPRPRSGRARRPTRRTGPRRA